MCNETHDHHVLSYPGSLRVDWSVQLGGCSRIRHPQCHHPTLLHAPWREVSFWYGLLEVHSVIRMECAQPITASVKVGQLYQQQVKMPHLLLVLLIDYPA